MTEVKAYTIRMKGKNYLYQGEDRFDANRRLFKDVVTGNIPLSDVGIIIVTNDNGEEYPMRLLPSLFAMGIIDLETTMNTLYGNGIDLSYKELLETIEQDKWLWMEK